jgi:PAS domain S-box-containing protein
MGTADLCKAGSKLRLLLVEENASGDDPTVWEMDYDGFALPGGPRHAPEKLQGWLASHSMSSGEKQPEAKLAPAEGITDLEQVQKALQNSESRLAGIIRSVTDAIVSIDEEQRIAMFNPAAERMFGLPAAQALGHSLDELIPARFRSAHAGHVRAFGETAVTRRAMCGEGALYVLRPDGTESPVEISISQSGTGAGKLLTAVVRDITERQRAEESARHLAAIVNSSDDAIFSKDLSGTILTWNRGAERLYGYKGAEIIGKPVTALVPPERRNEIGHLLRELAQGRSRGRSDTVGLRKDGSQVPVSLTVSPVKDAQGRIIGASTIAHDITERLQAEESARLAAIVGSSHDAIFSMDLSGRILTWNRGAERLYGYTSTEIVGRPVAVLVPPDRMDEIDHTLQEIAQGHVLSRDDTVRVRQDESLVPISLVVSPIRNAQGQITSASVIAHDITERKRVEELTRSNQDLERFAYVASHDLQEPLRMVSAYTQLLAERYHGRLDENADQYIGYAVDGAKRMQALIQDLLALSRVGRRGKERQAVECGAVVAEAAQNLKTAMAECGAVLSYGELPTAFANRSQMVQLFQNLIGNAVKFRGEKSPAISVSAERRGHEWVFAVADNGIGIPAEQRDRIFEIFQRLHSRTEYPGNGIGLSICKKIVEQHGGRIWVESEVGQGSAFKFVLPATSFESGVKEGSKPAHASA